MAKKTVKYSKLDGFEDSNFAISKVRITTMIDKDLLDWLKREAEKQRALIQIASRRLKLEFLDLKKKFYSRGACARRSPGPECINSIYIIQ